MWQLALGAAVGGVAQAFGASKASSASAKAANQSAQTQLTATRETNALQRAMYDETVARQKPWIQAGKASLDRLMPLGNEHKVPSFEPGNFEASPGYQFRLEQGQKAMDAAASARGIRMSGTALKGANDYAQGMASQEYGNWWNRELDQHNADMNSSNTLFNRNAAIAGVGQTAVNALQAAGQNTAGAIGNANMTGAANAGNSLMQAGQARASGYTGMANAFNNTLGDFGTIYAMNKMGYLQ